MAQLNGNARTQASLGNTITYHSGSTTGVSTLILGRVTDIDYQKNAVSYVALTSGSDSEAGTHGSGYKALLPVQFAGRNGYGNSYGSVYPIRIGDAVLIGFVDSKSTKPIVIGRYADTDLANEISAQDVPHYEANDESTYGEANKQITVFPDQSFNLHDGKGNRTLTFSGRTFMLVNTDNIYPEHPTDDGDEPQAYENIKDAYDGGGDLREPLSDKAPEIIFGHSGIINQEGTPDNHKLYFYVGQNGTVRLSMMQDDEDWRTYFEQTPDGGIKLRRQEDSKYFDTGSKSSEIGIDKHGYVTIRSQKTGMVLKGDGIYNLDGTKFSLSSGSGSGVNSDVEKRLLELQSQVEANNQKTITDFKVMDGRFSSVITQENFLGTLNNQVAAYQKQLDELKALMTANSKELSDMAEDGVIDPDEKQKLNSMWIDIVNAYPNVVALADRYSVDHKAFDEAYTDLQEYLTPILSDLTVESRIDGMALENKGDAYFNNNISVNSAIYDAITKALTLNQEQIDKMSTSIEQSAKEIALNASHIKSQGDTITEQQAQLTVMADSIGTMVSKKTFVNSLTGTISNATSGHANLVPRIQDTLDQYLDGTKGTLSSMSGASVSAFIDVEAKLHYTITVYKVTTTTKVSYAWLDSNKAYISGEQKQASTKTIQFLGILAPANAKYIRVSVSDKNVDIKLERGDRATAFVESYQDAINYGDTSSVVAQTKQDAEDVNSYASGANTDITDLIPKFEEDSKDGVITSDEKTSLANALENIKKHKTDDNYYAEVYGVDPTTYNSNYDKIIAYLQPIVDDKNDTKVDATTFNSNLNGYYSSRADLWLAISGVASDAITKAVQSLQGALNEFKTKTSENFTAIQEDADKIRLLAQSTESTVKSLKVGGTNIVLNSSDEVTVTGTSGSTTNTTTKSPSAVDDNGNLVSPDVPNNKSYSFVEETDDKIPWSFSTGTISKWGVTTGTPIAISFDYAIRGTNLLTTTELHVAANSNNWNYQIAYNRLEFGNTYTFSADVSVVDGKATSVAIIGYDPVNKVSKKGENVKIENGRVEYTFTPQDKETTQLLVYAGLVGSTAGIDVTYSNMRLEIGTRQGSFHLGLNAAPGVNALVNIEDLSTMSQEGHYSLVIPNPTAVFTTSIATRLQIKLINVPATTSITFTKVKLEMGNLATAWSPAPTDLATNEWSKTYIDVTAKGALTVSENYTDARLKDTKDAINTQINSSTDNVLKSAKTYTDSTNSATLTSTKNYTDSSTNNALTSAKDYTDSSSSNALNNAKDYADSASKNAVDGIVLGGANLIRNGNLQDGTLFWRTYGKNTSGKNELVVAPFVDASPWPAHAEQRMKIVQTTDKEDWGYAQDNIKVVGDTDYTISAYVAGGKGAMFSIEHGNGSSDPYKAIGFTKKTDTVERFEFSFRMPAGVTSTNVYFGFSSTGATISGTVYVSLIQMEEGNIASAWHTSDYDAQAYADNTARTNAQAAADSIQIGASNLIVNSRFDQVLSNWAIFGQGSGGSTELPDKTTTGLYLSQHIVNVTDISQTVNITVTGYLGKITTVHSQTSGVFLGDNGSGSYTLSFDDTLADGAVVPITFTDTTGSTDSLTVYYGSSVVDDSSDTSSSTNTNTTTTTIDPLISVGDTDTTYWPKGTKHEVIISRPSGVATNYGISQLVFVMPNTQYTLSAYWTGTGTMLMAYGNGSLFPQVNKTYTHTDNVIDRVSTTFTTPKNLTSMYVMFGVSDTTGASKVHISMVQLEGGNKVTDWMTSPDDINERLDNALSTAYASWQAVNPDNISQTVASSTIYADIESALASKSDNAAIADIRDQISDNTSAITDITETKLVQMQQTAHDWGVKAETALSATTEQGKITAAVQNYMNFDDSGLTFGKSNSKLKVNINNEQITFTDDGAKVAYISGQTMFITDAVVSNSMIIGRHKFSKDPNAKYSTIISWVGDIEN